MQMRLCKIHYNCYETIKNAPEYLKKEWVTENKNGTICGYLRKNTTYKINEVTCKLCIKELKKKGLIKKEDK